MTERTIRWFKRGAFSVLPVVASVAVLLLAGCASDEPVDGAAVKRPSGVLARYRVATPVGFQPIRSDVPEVVLEHTFYRIARDIRLLPKLHREIRGVDVTLLANARRDRFLFFAAVSFSGMDRAGRKAFLQTRVRQLFGNSPPADFQNTRSAERWDTIHSEGVRRDRDAVAQVSLYAVNRDSDVSYVYGGVWLSSGADPFAMDQILRGLKEQLTR